MAIPNALIEDRLRCIVMNYMKGPIEITVMEREEQLGQLPPNVFSFFYCLLARILAFLPENQAVIQVILGNATGKVCHLQE